MIVFISRVHSERTLINLVFVYFLIIYQNMRLTVKAVSLAFDSLFIKKIITHCIITRFLYI